MWNFILGLNWCPYWQDDFTPQPLGKFQVLCPWLPDSSAFRQASWNCRYNLTLTGRQLWPLHSSSSWHKRSLTLIIKVCKSLLCGFPAVHTYTRWQRHYTHRDRQRHRERERRGNEKEKERQHMQCIYYTAGRGEERGGPWVRLRKMKEWRGCFYICVIGASLHKYNYCHVVEKMMLEQGPVVSKNKIFSALYFDYRK